MKINHILQDLNELEKHMDKIKSDVYTNLGLVENHSLTDDELYKKCETQFGLFKQRLRSLQLDLKIEQKITENKKEMMSS